MTSNNPATLSNLTWEELEPFLVIDRKHCQNTVKGYKSKFKELSSWFQGKEFNRRNLTSFFYELKTHGKSVYTLNNHLKLAKHLCLYLSIKEELDDFAYFPEVTKQEEPLTPQEIIKLAEVSIRYERYKERRIKHRALIYFLGNVGSRIDETLKLEWTDLISNPFPMVHFRAAITKTKKERFCPIPKWLFHTLKLLPHTDKYIFSKIDSANFRKDLRLREVKLGIKKNVHPHLFRDSSINNKLAFGIPLEQVTAYHGHASTTTTYKYYIRIKAKSLAQSLYNFDPAFKDDQTYDDVCSAAKENLEKFSNPRVCNYVFETKINANNKKETIVKFIEK